MLSNPSWLVAILVCAIVLSPISYYCSSAVAADCNFKCVQTCTGVNVPCQCATLSCSGSPTYYRYTTGVVMTFGAGGKEATHNADLFCYYLASCINGNGSWFSNCTAGAGSCSSVSLFIYCLSCVPVAGNMPINEGDYTCTTCPG